MKNKVRVTVDDPFWNERIAIVQEQMLPFQWKVLNDKEPGAPKSGVIQNFKIAAGEAEGEFYGMVFQDTDLYKWLEAVAYSLKIKPNKQLKEWAEEAIRLIAAAQLEDGYVNTYFQVKVPQYRWTDFSDNHELYTAGHLIEAGVAYYEATGNQTIYHVIKKLGDCLINKFGYGKGQALPGHPEIELALLRLYKLTDEQKYLDLAKYFVLERGKAPNFFIEESKERRAKGIPSWLDINYNDGFVEPVKDDEEDVSYFVASQQLVEQSVVEGHAVRAGYLYSALAELAALENDQALKEAALRLWDNATTKQLYVTGGIGATNTNEGFTHDYDLPNESNYCETCAGISLIFWAKRMMYLDAGSVYAEIIEKTLYNNTLGSMSLDGKSFYYRNELERWGSKVKKAGRPKWHACACCPPNLARLLLSLDEYIYHVKETASVLYVDQFIGSKVSAEIAGKPFVLEQKAGFPWNGTVQLLIKAAPKAAISLAIRLPEWSTTFSIKLNGKLLYEGIDFTINKGYLLIFRQWKAGDTVDFGLDMTPKWIFAHPLVKYDAGKAAITRGPLVYCLEEEDNGNHLWQLSVPVSAEFSEEFMGELGGVVKVSCAGHRDQAYSHALYTYTPHTHKPAKLTAVPFYSRYNRSIGEMQVWTRVSEQ